MFCNPCLLSFFIQLQHCNPLNAAISIPYLFYAFYTFLIIKPFYSRVATSHIKFALCSVCIKIDHFFMTLLLDTRSYLILLSADDLLLVGRDPGCLVLAEGVAQQLAGRSHRLHVRPDPLVDLGRGMTVSGLG